MSIQWFPALVLVLAMGSTDESSNRFVPDGGVRPVDSALRAFSAVDLDGSRWTGDDFRGRVFLLDFWATWCAPCLAELPRLKALRERHSRADFEILGISLDVASRRSLVSWLNRQRIDWPQIHERSGYSSGPARLLGVDRLPRTFVVAADGRVAGIDLRGEELAALIDTLVAERTAPTGSGEQR